MEIEIKFHSFHYLPYIIMSQDVDTWQGNSREFENVISCLENCKSFYVVASLT